MAKTGSIASNFHQGARSEYLAQYFLTAFGTVVLTPRSEDHGIDLFCTLGEPIGKRLSVTDYYLVQVKSEAQDIEYDSIESVQWLTSLQYPFLICIVDKKNHLISLFVTTHLCQLRNLRLERIALQFGDRADSSTERDPLSIVGKTATLIIGPPILSYHANEFQGKLLAQAKEVLRWWLHIDERNIRWNSVGIEAGVFPKRIVTNNIPTSSMEFKGNFKSHLNSEKVSEYYETFFLLLGNEINIAASKSNKNHFEELSDAAGLVIKSINPTNSYGLRYLQIAINKGSEIVASNRKLILNVDGKDISTKNIKIEN